MHARELSFDYSLVMTVFVAMIVVRSDHLSELELYAPNVLVAFGVVDSAIHHRSLAHCKGVLIEGDIYVSGATLYEEQSLYIALEVHRNVCPRVQTGFGYDEVLLGETWMQGLVIPALILDSCFQLILQPHVSIAVVYEIEGRGEPIRELDSKWECILT
jgi:hypothetical protein